MKAIETLQARIDLGVSQPIDDFGTEYSILRHLKKFPTDRLKIGQSFIHAINLRMDDKAIATAVFAIAVNMNLKVGAEGVETNDRLAYLKGRWCQEIHGFYILDLFHWEKPKPF